ncbi:AraC family transcriptional regulator [Mediterraneibacter glycyrrhizinilyticus]|nr:AraC family transcriptional regulator [Mediterraneibacter glycyrrhizinilyticus]
MKGVEELNYRIETKEAFRILGVSAPLSKELEKNFSVVPQMWQDCIDNGTLEKLSQMVSASPTGLLGICVCNEEQRKYFIAVATSQDNPEFEEYTIPATTWAIFPGTGTNQSVQELERRIYTEWLPASGYEYGNAPDVEVYINPDPENTVFEVWIPVKKKNID